MKLILTFILLLFSSMYGFSQRFPLFSQYMNDALVINPAYTGSKEYLTASVMYRNQWLGVQGAPVTDFFCIHSPLKNNHTALGLLVYRDMIGPTSNTGVFANYAFRFQLGQGKLSLGIAGGISSLTNNWTSISTHDQDDQLFSSDDKSKILPNFSFGIYYYTSRYFIGISLPLFLTNEYNLSNGMSSNVNRPSNYDYLVNTGITLKANENLDIKPSLLFRYNSHQAVQVDLNTNLTFNNLITLGISYRIKESIIGIFALQATHQLKLGYSYDYSTIKLNTFGAGSHEVFIQYNFVYKVKAQNSRSFE